MLVIFGLPLVGLLGAMFSPSKPRSRKKSYSSKSKYSKPRNFVNYGPKSVFEYADNNSPEEFLVYFIENPKKNALKIGVGRAGRVNQLLNSYENRDEQSEKIGWQILRVAQFSNTYDDYGLGRDKAYEAERRVKFYWKSQGLEPFLSDEEMGFSKIQRRSTLEIEWIRTQGWSETAELGKVCEVSTWKYVMNSPGFLGESTAFTRGRELLLLNEKHAARTRPPNLKFSTLNSASYNSKKPSGVDTPTKTDENKNQQNKKSYRPRPISDGTEIGKFLARTKVSAESECVMWIGSVTDTGYGFTTWNGTLTPAHRIAWVIKYDEEIDNSMFKNQCGNRICVNTDHWIKIEKSEYECITPNCHEKSRTVLKAGVCEKCYQRAKVIRRAEREGRATNCPTAGCVNFSTGNAINSLCVPCSAKNRSRQLGLEITD